MGNQEHGVSNIRHAELRNSEQLKKMMYSKSTHWNDKQKLLALLIARSKDDFEVRRMIAYLSGFKTTPPTFREFIEDPEFAGGTIKLYDHWVDVGEKIFDTPYGSPYSMIVNQSAIGVGKTYFSSSCFSYELTRMLHYEDPHDRFNLDVTTKIVAAMFCPTIDLCTNVLSDPISGMVEDMPFLREHENPKRKIKGETKYVNNVDLMIASRGRMTVGRAVFTYIADELNDEVQGGQSAGVIRSMNRRMDSRFGNKDGTLPAGRAYLMSSARGNDSVVEEIVKNEISEEMAARTMFIQEPQWKVKPWMHEKPTWPVFIGSDNSDPFVYPTEDVPQTDLDDPDIAGRIIYIPPNTISAFKVNCVEALQDLAGITTLSSVMFFPTVDLLKAACTWPNMSTKPNIQLGLMDIQKPEMAIINTVKIKELKAVLQGKKVWIHLDPAFNGDKFGIALSIIDGWKTIERFDQQTAQTMKRSTPTVLTPLTISIDSRPGSEIPFVMVEDFIFDLRSAGIKIGKVTFDTFQSKGMHQRFVNGGIEAAIVSLDRTKEPYQAFRRMVAENRWMGTDMDLLYDELKDLRDTGKKIDHPPLGSKDVADAVCGSILAALESVDERSEGMETGEELEALDMFIRNQTDHDSVQEKLKGILGGGRSNSAWEDIEDAFDENDQLSEFFKDSDTW